ncbi:unnamed protein product [Orchesella dallaii]|uniref:ABC transporter domain-containing protein n=1 Tax=Orchesella dallaii TaxID=48710 RepID=A0ABP1Q3Q2_9HEXA
MAGTSRLKDLEVQELMEVHVRADIHVPPVLQNGVGRQKALERDAGLRGVEGPWRERGLEVQDDLGRQGALEREEILHDEEGPKCEGGLELQDDLGRQEAVERGKGLQGEEDVVHEGGDGCKGGFRRLRSVLHKKGLWRQKGLKHPEGMEFQEDLVTEKDLGCQPGPCHQIGRECQDDLDRIETVEPEENLKRQENLEHQNVHRRIGVFQRRVDVLHKKGRRRRQKRQEGMQFQEVLVTEKELSCEPGPSRQIGEGCQDDLNGKESVEHEEDLDQDQKDLKCQLGPGRKKAKKRGVWKPKVINPAELELQRQLWTQLPFDVEDPTTIWPLKWEGNVVVLKNAVVQYKICNDKREIQNKTDHASTGINLTVKKGTCHLITGHTGTGKSTILKILSGQCTLKSGTVSVLGSEPSKYVNRMYSKLVGVMPQQPSLYKEYTAVEFLRYFGNLHGVKAEDVESRIRELSVVFRLTRLNRAIGKYSGGQQRRLSLMTALIHTPAIVVLDEPMSVIRNGVVQMEGTFGYLKLTLGQWTLSDGICKYFEKKKKTEGEETNEGIELKELSKQPVLGERNEGFELAELRSEQPQVGERNGGFELTELRTEQPENDGPTVEASKQIEENLDSVIVQQDVNEQSELDESDDEFEVIELESEPPELGEIDEQLELDEPRGEQVDIYAAAVEPFELVEDANLVKRGKAKASQNYMGLGRNVTTTKITAEEAKKLIESHNDIMGSLLRLRSLVVRNFTRLYRSIAFLIFALSVPLFEVGSMYICYGQEPRDLTVGVYNGELAQNNMTACNYKSAGECRMSMVSCELIQSLSYEKLILKPYESKDEVVAAAKVGQVNGYFIVQSDFTSTLQAWFMFGGKLKPGEMEKLKIQVGVDYMELAYSTYISNRAEAAVQKFVVEFMTSCNLDSRRFLPPLLIRSTDYRKENFTYADFATSGTLLVIIFFFPMITTSIMLISDQADGTYQRGTAAGVRVVEYYTAQWITQSILLFFQSSSSILFIWAVFRNNFEGYVINAIMICMMVGKTGIMAGFVMSIVCTNLMASLYITIGLLIPTMAVAGVVWPMAGLKGWFHWVGLLSPIGLSVDALRAVINQGMGLDSSIVWASMTALHVWIAVLTVIYILVCKYFVMD